MRKIMFNDRYGLTDALILHSSPFEHELLTN